MNQENNECMGDSKSLMAQVKRLEALLKFADERINKLIAATQSEVLLHQQELAAYRFTVENREARIAELEEQLAEVQQAVQAAQPSDELIEAVDAWFAENTGLGGCSDKDVAELSEIFATHPTKQGDV